jgi:hypothetical protein
MYMGAGLAFGIGAPFWGELVVAGDGAALASFAAASGVPLRAMHRPANRNAALIKTSAHDPVRHCLHGYDRVTIFSLSVLPTTNCLDGYALRKRRFGRADSTEYPAETSIHNAHRAFPFRKSRTGGPPHPTQS